MRFSHLYTLVCVFLMCTRWYAFSSFVNVGMRFPHVYALVCVFIMCTRWYSFSSCALACVFLMCTRLCALQMTPPYLPEARGSTSTHHYDPEFKPINITPPGSQGSLIVIEEQDEQFIVSQTISLLIRINNLSFELKTIRLLLKTIRLLLELIISNN